MKKVYWIVGILIILALTAAGVYLVKTRDVQTNSSTLATIVKPTPEPRPDVPKAETYEVPILMYHYIRDAANEDELGKGLSVHPDNFGAQIKWLKDNGYASVKLADLADPEKKAISKTIYEKKKPVVISFDDGYTDAYTQAFPVLKKYGMAGTFFIIRNSVGKDDSFYMNQAQIDEMAKAGMEIGSHSLNHPDLTKISAEDLKNQLNESKLDADTFCYPAGRYNETVVKAVKEAGYVAAVTTKFGVATEKSSLLELKRVRIEDTGVDAFRMKIEAAIDETHKNG